MLLFVSTFDDPDSLAIRSSDQGFPCQGAYDFILKEFTAREIFCVLHTPAQ